MHLSALAWVFVILAAVFALGDWIAVSAPVRSGSRLQNLEYACKPAVPIALMAATLATTPTPHCARGWFVAAFGLCLVGDVLLMLPGDRLEAFGGGLVSFLVAQICLITAFVKMGAQWLATGLALAALVALVFLPAASVVRAIARGTQRWLIAPLLIYMLSLLLMAATATSYSLANVLGTTGVLACLGGLFFVASDTLLAVNRFVRPLPLGQLGVHATYHVAIILLFLGGVATTVH